MADLMKAKLKALAEIKRRAGKKSFLSKGEEAGNSCGCGSSECKDCTGQRKAQPTLFNK